jgi:hypothetical protein
MMNYNTNIQQQQIGRSSKYEVNRSGPFYELETRGIQLENRSSDLQNNKKNSRDKEISERIECEREKKEEKKILTSSR